jgi:hypothetical protein
MPPSFVKEQRMKPRHPIRTHAAARGGLCIGTRVVPLPAVSPLAAHRSGSRLGGMSGPI